MEVILELRSFRYRCGSTTNRTVRKAQILLRSGGQVFGFFPPKSWRPRAGLSQLGQPYPLSLVKSDSSSSAARFWVAVVKPEIAVAVEDMAVLNSAIWLVMPDAVAPVPPLVPLAGPLPGVLLGCISCQCLAFWAGVKYCRRQWGNAWPRYQPPY